MASELGVQTIQHTNGTDAATIDSTGRILTPARPAFHAYGNQSAWQSDLPDNSWHDDTSFTSTVYNVGNCYSTTSCDFTAPIDGIYAINFWQWISLPASNSFYMQLVRTRGATSTDVVQVGFGIGSTGSGNRTLSWAGNLLLESGDVIKLQRFRATTGSQDYFNSLDHAGFQGHLVG